MTKEDIITISQVFWSVPDLKFADNILHLGLKIKKTKSRGPNFNTYILPNKTEIIAFVEDKHDFKIYDSCIRLSVSKSSILSANKIFKEFKYDCHLTESPKYNITTLSCFAPSPHKNCEIIISNFKG